MNRDDAFAAAKKKRAEEKAKEEARKEGGSWGDFEPTVYAPLMLNQYRAFRILGGPHQMRQEPTDTKLIEQSKILGDDGKRFVCTWPTKEENPNWILRKVYEKLIEGTWSKDESGKNKKTFAHLSKHPEMMNRVLYNDNPDNQYEQGWRPGKAILMNVIDRHDKEYHMENKKSKVLSKKMSVYGENNEKTYFDRGVPQTVYNLIWDEIVEYEGNWENYDVVVKKVDGQPYYKAWYGGSDDLRKKLSQDDPETMELLSTKPLERWEKDLELYDFDKIAPVTSYNKLFNKLSAFFKVVDGNLGTSFYDELKDLKEKESAEVAKEKAEEAEEEAKAETKEVKSEEKSEVAEEKAVKESKPKERTAARPTREAKPKESTIDWECLSDGSFNGTIYKGVSQLTDDEKSQIISVKEDGSFEYVKEWNGEDLELFEESNTKFESPGTFHICPLTGLEFS